MNKPTDAEVTKMTDYLPHPNSGEHDELIDFSSMSPEELSGYVMSELRHPSVLHLTSDRLAEFIQTHLMVKQTDDPLARSLTACIEQSEIFSDTSLYDAKMATDEVFSYLARALQASRGDMERSTQRKVILGLLNLRGTFSAHATPEDRDWKEVVVRLLA